MAGNPNDRLSESRTLLERRRQSRRPSGVQRESRNGDDRTVVCAPRRWRLGECKAARLTHVSLDSVPTRPTRPRVPHSAPRSWRPAGLPESKQGSRLGRLLHWFRWSRRGRPTVCCCSQALRRCAVRRSASQPVHCAARGRGTRRGQYLGGGVGPHHSGVGKCDVGCRLQPPITRPSGSGVRIDQWTKQFEAAGWHVVTVKYSQRLRSAFDEPGGEDLQAWLDAMPNEQYQSLFALSPVRYVTFLDGAPPTVADFCAPYTDDQLRGLVTDLGGHDLTSMLAAYAECDAEVDRPSVVFAYTVKGWSLPLAGIPNHSALMTTEQIDLMRQGLGLTALNEWDRLPEDSLAGQWARARGDLLERPTRRAHTAPVIPRSTGVHSRKPVATQEAFGRVLVDSPGMSRSGSCWCRPLPMWRPPPISPAL